MVQPWTPLRHSDEGRQQKQGDGVRGRSTPPLFHNTAPPSEKYNILYYTIYKFSFGEKCVPCLI